jgi:hypothetical protein
LTRTPVQNADDGASVMGWINSWFALPLGRCS